MKNAINYFYNMIIDDIHQNNKLYYFDYMGYHYALIVYDGEVDLLQEIYNLHLEVLKRGVYVHQIILNKDGSVATLINGVPYILMRLYYEDREIVFDDLLPFFNCYYNNDGKLNRNNWENLWANKIDYLEYEISQLGQKHPEIRDTFSYFVGLGETSIQITNMVNNRGKDEKLMAIKSISHDRIKNDATLFDLYNPLNLVVDYRVRNVAEYLKHRYFEGDNIEEELNKFFMYTELTNDEYLLFLARMIYPTYYFDLYEDIISGSKSSDELKKITNRVNDYQVLIQSIYNYYKSFLRINPIEWLEMTTR
ncbi:MAG: hypothetical protein HFH47_00220 [Bacilli bacterium]|nr:hypothetical protein [Bacilli bacterium]